MASMKHSISAIIRFRSRLHGLVYNFGWHQYPKYLNGTVTRLAAFVPVVGYLILFNDWVSRHLTFGIITGNVGAGFITQQFKLQLLYFGLIFLGIANILYRAWRPFPMRQAENQFDYVNFGLNNFSIGAFVDMHSKIRTEGHRTLSGKYYDSEWEGFLSIASVDGEGTNEVRERSNWQEAKSRYEHILRGILTDWWFRHCIERRARLCFVLIIATIGYFMIALPSLDLFWAVIGATVLR